MKNTKKKLVQPSILHECTNQHQKRISPTD